tara:strand:- start:413 stop:1939 length:1527 start_codon:yes stop_codon:yes gene_type:complete
MGSGHIITDAERTSINNISGVIYTLPNASKTKATGGQISSYTSNNIYYTVHTFISTEHLEIHENVICDFLIVGGGGGGGSKRGGGGGAGGVVIGEAQTLTPSTYEVKIGSGGAASPAGNHAAVNGTDSEFNSFIAKGGGGGTSSTTNGQGNTGGSGGGSRGIVHSNGGIANQNDYDNVINVSGYGNNGGSTSDLGGSGGGGAGGAGINATTKHGSYGGIGIQNDFQTNTNIYYGGGGGGAGNEIIPYTGGAGGGGTGGRGAHNSTNRNGVDGLGGGGGSGGGTGGGGSVGGSGGDGVFIIRYADNTSIGGIKLGNGFNTDASGTLNFTEYDFTNTATDTTLGSFKVDTSSNLVIDASGVLDVKLPLIYTDTSGAPTSISAFDIIKTINSNTETIIHEYTFIKPAICVINSSWSGRYKISGGGNTTFLSKFQIGCSGTTYNSDYYIQKWLNEDGTGNVSATLSGISHVFDSPAVKSYSGNVIVRIYIKRTESSDVFNLYTSHLKILLYN